MVNQFVCPYPKTNLPDWQENRLILPAIRRPALPAGKALGKE